MKCDYDPKFLHFVIAVDVGTFMFFTSIFVFLIMGATTMTPTGDRLIVKELSQTFTIILICSFTTISLGLLASVLVLSYDLVVMISAKPLRKLQGIIREELLVDGEEQNSL